jgi:O-acetyl-ADP-ribose deacetylase (regulator of RNase III)
MASSKLSVVRADITSLDVDAIVNAANTGLLGGGGVDGAIHRAAGPALLAACRTLPEVRPGVRCPTGDARITPGFCLKARYVIHTAGPVWRGGDQDERGLLASCYRASMALARDHRVESIAFPAISCGIYGFPIDEAAHIAVREIRAASIDASQPSSVLLVAFGDEVYAALCHALASAKFKV